MFTPFINLWTVLAVAVLNMALGALWYSPMLLGKKWMHFIGWSHEEMEKHKKHASRGYVWTFVGSLVTAYVLAHFVDYTGAENFLGGMQTGFWVWLGFVAPMIAGSYLWEGKPLGYYLINVSYYFIALLLMGGVLAAWI